MPKLVLANGAEVKVGDTVWTLDGDEVVVTEIDDATHKLTLTPTSESEDVRDRYQPRHELARRIGARLVD